MIFDKSLTYGGINLRIAPLTPFVCNFEKAKPFSNLNTCAFRLEIHDNRLTYKSKQFLLGKTKVS